MDSILEKKINVMATSPYLQMKLWDILDKYLVLHGHVDLTEKRKRRNRLFIPDKISS